LTKLFLYIILNLTLTGLISCNDIHNNNIEDVENLFNHVKNSSIKYADLFDIYTSGNNKKVVIHSPLNNPNDSVIFYLLDETFFDKYKHNKNVLKYPLTNIAVLTATQLDGIIRLGLLNKVIGISDAKGIKNEVVMNLIKKDAIKEIYSLGHIHTEKALLLNPQAIFYSPLKQNQNITISKTIITIPFFDFMEDCPLGRAEWIKFTSAFIGNEHKADSIFNNIEKQYNALKMLTTNLNTKPTVFSGKYFNGQWYLPGGKSYMAKIFADAGADYLWKNNTSPNSFILDFEVVFNKAKDADFWRLLGGLNLKKDIYAQLIEENELYGYFKAFKQHRIIYCDPDTTFYFEKSTLEPQIILADFILAFHPELLPGYKAVYYKVIH
jgi:iron complex transport system substrate-binding protein